MSRRVKAASRVSSRRVLRDAEDAVVDADKEAGLDSFGVTATASKLVITADPVFQPPSAAAELPVLDSLRPRRRRRAAK